MKMSQENPYMTTYLEYLSSNQSMRTKQNFYTLAINLGQVHNVLGQMISDIIKIMGTFSFDERKNNTYQQKNIDTKRQQSKQQNAQINRKDKRPKSPLKEKYIPEKMQVENYPMNPPIYNASYANVQRKKINLDDFIFQTEQKPKQDNIKPFKNNPFSDLFFSTDKKDTSQSSLNTSQRKNSGDSSSSNTQTAQIVRYNQEQRKLVNTNSFQELNQYVMEQQKDSNPFKVNVKGPKVEQKKVKKEKSPFFDLFDSSQTQSYQLQQNFADPYKLNDFEKKYGKYPQTQVNQNSSNFLKKQQRTLYSPQIKRDKPVNNNTKKTTLAKPSNLLEETRWNSSVQQNMFDVQEIDEIQSTQKKPVGKIQAKKKNQQKQQVKSADQQYIPRREQNGRKKSDRQDLKGSQCPDCKAFYDAVSDDSKNFKDMCQCTSRHKSSTTFMQKHKVNNYSQDFGLD